MCEVHCPGVRVLRLGKGSVDLGLYNLKFNMSSRSILGSMRVDEGGTSLNWETQRPGMGRLLANLIWWLQPISLSRLAPSSRCATGWKYIKNMFETTTQSFSSLKLGHLAPARPNNLSLPGSTPSCLCRDSLPFDVRPPGLDTSSPGL